jgi:hypothetical protein
MIQLLQAQSDVAGACIARADKSRFKFHIEIDDDSQLIVSQSLN